MATNYITIHDLAETTDGNVSENAELIINNGNEAVVATKAKLSSILHDTNASIANLDGDIVDVEADIVDIQTDLSTCDFLKNLPNYDATKTLTLKSVNGVIQWVEE